MDSRKRNKAWFLSSRGFYFRGLKSHWDSSASTLFAWAEGARGIYRAWGVSLVIGTCMHEQITDIWVRRGIQV
jgi:hypothetical protein